MNYIRHSPTPPPNKIGLGPDYDAYLAQPCDAADCGAVASSNAGGGKWCNAHLPVNVRSFCRND